MPNTDTTETLPAPQLNSGPKIGYVLKMYPRFSETFIVTEILAREAAGADIEIFSLRPPIDPRFHDNLHDVKAPVRYVPRIRRAPELWAQLAAARGVLGDLDPDLLDLLLASSAEDAGQALDIAVRARQSGITHLHAHFASVATTVARLAAKVAGITYSFTAHAKDLFHQDVDPADLRVKAIDADHVVTISRYNVDHLLSVGAPSTSLHLVYNGLDLRRFAPASPNRLGGLQSPDDGDPSSVFARELRIVGVGRLVEKKGFEYLIDACALLQHWDVPVRCDIVGGGEREQALGEQIERAGLTGVVRLLGPLPQEQVRDVVGQADVLAAPCVVGSDGNADGLPTVVLEAMALGTPCVTTDVTGLIEAIDHETTGLLVDQRDARGLAEALRRIHRDSDLALRLAQAGRARVEEAFDSRRQAEHLNALLPLHTGPEVLV